MEVKFAVIYRRIGSEKRSGVSPDTIKKYCNDNGLTLTHIYEDISGRENRQGYQEMLKVIEPGWFVVIYDSRLNRNVRENINFYYDLIKMGCIIVLSQRKNPKFTILER